MSKSKPPRPSQQELNLQTQQTAMLAAQQRILEQQWAQQQKQYEQQQQLAPLLYEEMGLRPQYNAEGAITGFERFETPEQQLYRTQIEAMQRQQPIQEQLQQQYLTLAQQQAEYQQRQQPMMEQLQATQLRLAQQQADYQAAEAAWREELEPTLKAQREQDLAFQKQAMEFQQAQLRQMQEQQRLQPLLYEASGVRPIYDESGQITGFGLTERAQARQDYEDQLLEHQRKALAGELPVDPTLERALQEGETKLRAQLQAQLGTGYETSTPGIQALEEYRKRAAEARSTVAHGQLTSGQALFNQQVQMNDQQLGQAMAGRGLLGDYGLRPVQFGQGVQVPGMPSGLSMAQAATPGLFQAGSPTSTAAGYQAAVASPYGTLGQFGDLASRYGNLVTGGGNLVNQLQRQRLGEYEMQEKMRNEYAGTLGTIGAAAGTIIGSVFAPGVGTAAGATLGGMAGSTFGRATY